MTAAENPSPIPVAAPDFQAKLEPLLKMAAQQGREIIVTQHGYPVARVTPYAPQPGDPPFPVMEKPAGVPYGPNRTPAEQLQDLVGPMPLEWWFGQEARWEDASIREDIVETRDRDGKVGARKRVTIKLLGDAVELSDGDGTVTANPDRAPNPDAEPAGGEIPTPKPGEPPILEDVIEIKDADGNVVERKVFHLQIWGDIIAPIDEEWEAEVNPDRVLNPYLPRTAATADPDPDKEPLILEDVFEIKDADGNVVERKVFHFTIRGDAVPPINEAWKDEVNPDRTLNPC